MFLQGDLQKVFDALYHMGVIDPVLKMDWNGEFERIETEPWRLQPVVEVVNECRGDHMDLIEDLASFDQQTLSYLAMLVAKELMHFHTNTVVH